MAFPDYEKLFLLEVVVDVVSISNSMLNLDLATKSNLKETYVTFKFLNYPPLVVCKEDFYKPPSNQDLSQLNFKSGKSYLFSISSSEVPTLPYQFDINVSVVRKVEPEGKIILGTSIINLGDSFTALMHSSVAEPDLPLQKTKSGTFDIYDDNKRKIGFINSFLRLSCYGELIVTQFQVGANKDAFMFKGTEHKNVVEIQGDSTKMPKIQVDPNYVNNIPVKDVQTSNKDAFMFTGTEHKNVVEIQGDSTKIPGIQVDPNYVNSRPVKDAQTSHQVTKHATVPGYGDVSESMFIPFQQQNMEHGNCMIPYYNYEQPLPPQDTSNNYKEIVAEIRGHSLHIRVPTKSNKEVLCKKQLVEEMEGPVCKHAPQLDFCDCDFPVPPEAIPRCGPL